MDNSLSHCLAGNSLLLTGHTPGPDHCGEAARAGQGCLVSKTHYSAQNLA